jgi:methylglutaconyl-CoA hydratase
MNLRILQEGPILRLTMARPERRNALSRGLVAALYDAFAAVAEGSETRVVVLDGEGAVFCAGGDIDEFAAAAADRQAGPDAEGISAMLAAVASCPAPVVATVRGAAYGGGVGLVCAADIAVASDGARFSLSEARLGLVAAVIAPHVIAALGPREAVARMLLAAPFDAAEALRIGLVHQTVSDDRLDAAVEAAVTDLLRGAPGALATIKRLPTLVAGDNPSGAMTALLAERLASDEGQEGLRAFLEKRPAAWVPR